VLNGESRTVGAGLTVAGLLRSLELVPGMVVVERNREILARDALQTTPVEEGDRIELVHFVGGG
jgi:thiamine biosynthesis protein ThiS